MSNLDDFLLAYAGLEQSIRSLMTSLFSETCGICTACCCRADICEESTESAFLSKLLEKQGLSMNDMDDRLGWLDLHGCSLEYGRPPVCYSYYCDELLARLPDEESRFVARTLGQLLHHVGHDALGGWHLVEIMNDSDLGRLDLSRMHRRLEEAKSAFDAIGHYLQTNRLGETDRLALAAITTENP